MSYRPARGFSGFAVVALHALAIVAIANATRWREALEAATPLTVSLVAEPRPSTPERPARVPVPRLAMPALELVPIPQIAVTAPQAAATITVAQSASPAASSRFPSPAALPSPEVRPPAFDADYLENPAPAYPSLSRRLGEEGKVVVRVWVSAEGRAEKVELARPSGFARLDRSALDAVSRWRFVPARQGAQAVAASVLVPVAFVLKG